MTVDEPETAAPLRAKAPKAWNAARRRRFLDHLAATCNVSEAATVAGLPKSDLYHRRRREPAFAAEWAEAVALGYAMLETRLLGHALAGGGEKIAQDGAFPAIEVSVAMKLLAAHRDASAPMRGGRALRHVTPQETDAALMKALAAAERKLGLEAA